MVATKLVPVGAIEAPSVHNNQRSFQQKMAKGHTSQEVYFLREACAMGKGHKFMGTLATVVIEQRSAIGNPCKKQQKLSIETANTTMDKKQEQEGGSLRQG